MKFTKPVFISALLALALAGCSSTKDKVAFLDLTHHQPISIQGAVKKSAKIEETDLQRWSHLDIVRDSIPGMSVDRAYTELIKDHKGAKVIVGIVDSGVDINHPDLKPVVWTNAKEIANNGKDDDKNGFIDDVHGWNFLGDAVHDNYEFIRLLKKPNDGSADYKRAGKEFEQKMMEANAGKQQLDFFMSLEPTIQAHLKKDSFTLEDVKAIDSKDEKVIEAKETLERVLAMSTLEEFKKRLEPFKNQVDSQMNYHFNKNFNGRKIIGDNPDDITDTKYGNNNVIGPVLDEALHGTHVAGIVAQVRHNGIG